MHKLLFWNQMHIESQHFKMSLSLFLSEVSEHCWIFYVPWFIFFVFKKENHLLCIIFWWNHFLQNINFLRILNFILQMTSYWWHALVPHHYFCFYYYYFWLVITFIYYSESRSFYVKIHASFFLFILYFLNDCSMW